MKNKKRSILVTHDCPLVVSDTESCMEYENVYWGSGAYIEIRSGKKFIIHHLIPYDESMELADSVEKEAKYIGDSEWQYDIIVTSTPGKRGSDGGNGGNGHGEGADGGAGGNGSAGAPGGDDSIRRPPLTLIIEDAQMDVSVLNIGGLGGRGGDGGNGGNGGDSDKEGCGGIGGSGGNGGNGGNGGDGCNLTIKFGSSKEKELTCQVEKAPGGQGGRGGAVGTNGKNSSSQGKEPPHIGNDGMKGSDGQLGTIKVIKLENVNK